MTESEDLYKLEWIHSLKTIHQGITSNLNKDPFLDTIVVCNDGVVTHNKLVLGLLFPELLHVPIFDLPQEQTVLMPDFAIVEVQTRITEMFPGSEMATTIRDDEVEMANSGSGTPDNFEHFLEADIGASRSPKPFGMRRGRGRPPLNTARMPPRFTCDFCNKGFFYRSMLTAHEKLHTGGSRETCELCGAEYSTRQNLKNHMIKQHGEDSFTPRKRGRPPLDPERRAAQSQSSSLSRGVNLLRPGYRGRGRPPLMSRHAGLTHHESYQQQQHLLAEQQQQADSLSDDLSAESFMEQKMENDSDGEERSLEAIRKSGAVCSKSNLPAPNEINKDETEDVKPDINSLNAANNFDATTSERPESNTNLQENNATITSVSATPNNSYHNNFPVPGRQQQQLYNQQGQSYNNSYGSLNTQFYNSMQMQQQLMIQQQQMLQQQQQPNLQQSTSQQNFYDGESQPTAGSYPQSQETLRPKEYKVKLPIDITIIYIKLQYSFIFLRSN